MKVKIGEREIEMHYSLRMYMLYENIVDKSFNLADLNNYTNILTLFYCAVLSSMQYHKMELDLKSDEFIDWLDTKGSIVLSEFSTWYFENLKLQDELVDKATEEKLIAEATEKNNKKSDKKGKLKKNAK